MNAKLVSILLIGGGVVCVVIGFLGTVGWLHITLLGLGGFCVGLGIGALAGTRKKNV